MKRGTPRHPKMYALAEALSIPLAHAVGIMDMLWEHAGQQTPRGDIGSLPDAAIAAAVGWRKPPQLIEALVLSGWVDKDPEYRLVIHDWSEHCEQTVVKWLDYNKKGFLPIYRVSLENRKRKSSKSLPSREVKAKVEANGEGKTKTENPEVSLPPGYAMDEQFEDFRNECKSWGMNVIDPEDFIAAWPEWRVLDGLQRVEAIEGIVARRDSGADPQFAKNPKNYLRGREWKRALKAVTGDVSTTLRTAIRELEQEQKA